MLFRSIEPVTYGTGKPEKSLYDAEQEKLKAEIEVVQKKLVSTSVSCTSAYPSILDWSRARHCARRIVCMSRLLPVSLSVFCGTCRLP